MYDTYPLCYVCKKLIKTKDYYYIGKNLEGFELYRHLKCRTTKLTSAELKIRKHWIKNPQTIVHKNKRTKSRQQKKINLKRNTNENIYG